MDLFCRGEGGGSGLVIQDSIQERQNIENVK